MLPYENASGFPDVAETVISAAPDAVRAAQQIKTLLGVGEVNEDESLQAGHVVVVVGADFVAPRPDGEEAVIAERSREDDEG
jgi:deoxyribose-phosphate aldolase